LADEFILETHGLTKEFAGFFAVRDVALKVRRGSIHALIGPNGAGKTTCFNLLTKFLSPSAGTITYKGQDITGMAPADVARLGLVRSFQISAVFPHLTALENVRVALQRQHGHSCDSWRAKAVLDKYNNRARELLSDLGLSEFEKTPAVEMPYGRKRALEIATTLALDPQLVCYSWMTGIAEVAQVVFVRKSLVEVQYLRTTITDEQRQEFGHLVEGTIHRIESADFLPHGGIRFRA